VEIRDLRTFLTVVEAGGVTRGAERLHVVQSAASTAIKRLESELGVVLLERSRAGVRPTEAGDSLVGHAQVVLNAARRAERDMAAFRGLERGTVRLGMVHTAVPLVLAPLLRMVRARHPGLLLEVEEGGVAGLEERLRRGHLDLAVFYLPVELDGLDLVRLASVRLSVLAPKTHRLSARRAVTLASLADEEWISFPRSNPGRRWLDDACSAVGFEPRMGAEIETLAQLKAFVEAGAGIALLPRQAAEPELSAGLLHELAVRGRLPPVALALALHQGKPSPAVRAIRSLLSDAFLPGGTPARRDDARVRPTA
jgi:DNA-binding transcriptional LysR family regulator